MIQSHQETQARHTHFPNSGLASRVGSRPFVAAILPNRVDGISAMSRAESFQERRTATSHRPWYGENDTLASAIAFSIGFMAISVLTLEG